MQNKKSLNEAIKRFNKIADYDIHQLNQHLNENRSVAKTCVEDKYAGTDLFEHTRSRIANLMEFTLAGNNVMDEADDDPNNNPVGGDGGADPMGGGMNPSMDGAGGADPMGGGADPMGGGAGPMGGGAGPMGGGADQMDGMDPNGGQAPQGPEGFNPQVGDDTQGGADPMGGMDPSMGGTDDSMGGGMQPDDEVVDVTELTDKQDDTEEKVEKLGDKFDKLFKAIGQFEELIKQNDEKLEKLSTEFEKRNPTQIEKLSMQTDKSYPFNVTPSDFWKEKEATSNYSTDYDNNGKDQGQYAITANDIKGDVDWKSISDSLDDDDFLYNQTMDKILNI